MEHTGKQLNSEIKTEFNQKIYYLKIYLDEIVIGIQLNDLIYYNWILKYFQNYFNEITCYKEEYKYDKDIINIEVYNYNDLIALRNQVLNDNNYIPEIITYHSYFSSNRKCEHEYCVINDINGESKKIIVFIPNKCEEAKYTVIRIIRNILIHLSCNSGLLYLHAAAVEKNGSGIAIVGNKYAGKTTTLINLITYGDCSFITNDKLLLNGCKETYIYGLPISIGIRSGTILKNKILFDKIWFNRRKFEHYLCQRELDGLDSEEEYIKYLKENLGKIFLLPYELCNLLDTNIVSKSPLKIIIIPEYNINCVKPEINKVSKKESQKVIENNVLEYDGFRNKILNNNKTIIAKFLDSVEVFKIEYNENLVKSLIEIVDNLLKSNL